MTLIRFQPYREIETLQRQLNRLFDTEFNQLAGVDNGEKLHTPAAELKETDDAIHLSVEIPGMNAADLNVEVTAEAVSISGERKSETKTEENGVVRSEFRYGRFHRVIPLPTRVQNTQVEANYTNGILALTLPKVEEAKNKVVKVNLN
jgi:HSP20 family protein